MPSNNKYTKSFLSSSDAYYNLHRTTELLMETPFYKKTLAENAELKDKVRYLQYTVDYLEMKNKALRKKLKNKPILRRQSEKQDEVVFIEVKTRSSNKYGTPFDAISPQKLRLLIMGANFYKYILHPDLPEEMRIDAIGVMVWGNEVLSIEHLENVSGF